MLQSRQAKVLAAAGPKFDDDRPSRQSRLLRQINLSLTAAAENRYEAEFIELFAGGWEQRLCRVGTESTLTLQQRRHLRGPLWKSPI
jgi:hypothetical protein